MNPDRDFTAPRASLHDAKLYIQGFTVRLHGSRVSLHVKIYEVALSQIC
jgi:hypothetical protein